MKQKKLFLSFFLVCMLLMLFNCTLSDDEQMVQNTDNNAAIQDGTRSSSLPCTTCQLRYDNASGRLIWWAVNFGQGDTVSQVFIKERVLWWEWWSLITTKNGTGEMNVYAVAGFEYKVYQYGYNPYTMKTYEHTCTLYVR